MSQKADYRAKAEECLRVASETSDVGAASVLRRLAADYLDLAERTSQQQQQIQPNEPGRDK
jgi:hypothetical protein